MKRFFITFALLLLMSTSLLAAQPLDPREQAGKLASAIAVPLYGYDLATVASIIEAMVKDTDAIRAVDILDSISEKVLFEAFKSDDNTIHSGEPIPETHKKELQLLIHSVVHEQEEIAELRLYFIPGGEGAVHLTGEERAWLAAHPIIRVHNEKDWPPFNYFEYGKPLGLSIDYMNLVAEQLGIKVEYVSGPSWNEFLEMVKRKELDVMLNIVKTEDRMQYLLYTEPYIKNPNVIVSSQESPYETIEALFGKTVAFPKGFYYEEVLTKSFPRIKRLPEEDALASLKAVAFGRADAALGEAAVVRTLINKNFISGLQISGEVKFGDPDLTNMRIGVRDDWPLLHSALMKAMAAIAPQEMTQIRQKWLIRATDEKDRIPLTDAERKWLAEHRDIRLGVDPAWPPFEFIDKSGHYAGVGSGFIDAISDRLKIKMTPIPGLTWTQVIEKSKAGEIDVLPAVMRTSERDKYLNFTKPYLSFPTVIVINKKMSFIGSIKGLEGYRVGVVKDYYTEDILRQDHPNLELVTYPTLEEALQKLDAGRIDAVVDNMITITQEIARSGLENIRVSSSTEYTFELSLGVRKDLPELIGILNKVIDDISSQEKAAITSAWMSDVEVKIRFDFKAILAWAIPIGGSVFLIITFVVVWNRKLGREIKERKRTEDQLRKLSSATENSPASVVVTDKNGNIEYVNPTFIEVTGYSAEEAIGQNPSVLKSGDLPESYYQELWDTILDGKVWRGEFKNQRKNGEEFWESASISPIMDEEGEITHFVAVKQDTTERKAAEEALRASEEKSRLLLESVGEGIFGVDLDGKVAFINPAATRMLGYRTDELIGKAVHEQIHHSHADGSVYPKSECPMYLTHADGTDHHIADEVLWRKDGSSRRVHQHADREKWTGRRCGRHLYGYHRAQAGRGRSGTRRNFNS